MFEDLAKMLTDDYIANGRRSLSRCEDSITHLRGYFSAHKASDITSDQVTSYITSRQSEKAANSTINGELSALGRMFTLALRAGRVGTKPHIQKLALNNARTGFFEREQLDSLLRHLPDEIKPVITVAYITGWRVTSEILTRQRHHVNFKHGSLRLEPGETKNNRGREFPLTPMLRQVLEQQNERTEAFQKANGMIVPWLFHRSGKPIKYFRGAWLRACRAAGLSGKIPHDFRRTVSRSRFRYNKVSNTSESTLMSLKPMGVPSVSSSVFHGHSEVCRIGVPSRFSQPK